MVVSWLSSSKLSSLPSLGGRRHYESDAFGKKAPLRQKTEGQSVWAENPAHLEAVLEPSCPVNSVLRSAHLFLKLERQVLSVKRRGYTVNLEPVYVVDGEQDFVVVKYPRIARRRAACRDDESRWLPDAQKRPIGDPVLSILVGNQYGNIHTAVAADQD